MKSTEALMLSLENDYTFTSILTQIKHQARNGQFYCHYQGQGPESKKYVLGLKELGYQVDDQSQYSNLNLQIKWG